MKTNLQRILKSKTDEPQWVGSATELLTAVLGYLSFQQIIPLTDVTSTVNLVAVALLIVWRVWKKRGLEKIVTLIRKGLSLAPAVLVAFEVMGKDQASALFLVFPPMLAMIWSFKAKEPVKTKYP